MTARARRSLWVLTKGSGSNLFAYQSYRGLDFDRKEFGVHVALGDFIDGTSHHDRKLVADFDADFTTRHMHGEVAIDETEAMSHGGAGATAAAGGEGVTGTAFPDFDLDIGAVQNFEKLDVGLAWEISVGLEVRAVFVGHLCGDFR